MKARVQDGGTTKVPDSPGEEVPAGEQAGQLYCAGAEVPGQAGGRVRLCAGAQVHHRTGASGEKGKVYRRGQMSSLVWEDKTCESFKHRTERLRRPGSVGSRPIGSNRKIFCGTGSRFSVSHKNSLPQIQKKVRKLKICSSLE